jgi:hypothetical protein
MQRSFHVMADDDLDPNALLLVQQEEAMKKLEEM